MLQSLALVSLLVRDYDEAIGFFVRALGFALVEDRPVPEQHKRWVVVAPAGGGAGLLLARASTPEQQALVGRQSGGRVWLFMHTDDFARDHARFSASGVRFVDGPRQEAYGRVAVFEDLYGNRWDLIEPGAGRGPAQQLDGVRAAYDRWAPVYEEDGNPLLALEQPAVRAAVGDPCGLDALDLGTGTGRHAVWMAAAGARVTALDFSEGMLARARARARAGTAPLRFMVHDLAQPLPLPDASFDLVVSGLVLEHLGDLDLFFAEARRVLRRHGRAVVSTLHPAMFLRGAQARFTDPGSGALVQPGSVPHPLAAFVMAALQAGFRLLDLVERAPDGALAATTPRAARYVGWPMLLLLVLQDDR